MHRKEHKIPFLRRAAAGVAAAASAALVLAGCALPGQPGAPASGSDSGSASAGSAVPPGLERFYTQKLAWKGCGDSFDCAVVQVPMDYARPEAETIELSLIRKRGTKPQGTLLVNPGGPGSSGVDLVRDASSLLFSAELRSGYDIVGFDPRGVSRSTPVVCATDAERDADRQSPTDLWSDAGLAEAQASSSAYAAACAEKTGVSLAYVDTVSAARDLDVLRAVNGDDKLNYLGYSYGTKLGAAYAGLFPENVGRLVLDGAMDPSKSNEDVTLGQAKAFESEIRSYMQNCLATAGCPFTGDLEQGLSQLRALFADIEKSPPTAADGRLVPIVTFVSGFIVPLYDNASWPTLTQALASALAGDPSTMLYLADLGAGRNDDGTYSNNSSDAFSAYNCMDYPMVTDLAEMKADARELEQASPTIGRYLGYGGMVCKDWKYPPTGQPAPASAPGAAPIVVIGTTKDPATPYEWSQALASQLESAVLVTFEGHGHTAYGRSNDCIVKAVDSYFLDGTVPSDGLMC